MNADRELDVKVAERLGWTEVHFDDKPDFDGDTRKPSMEWFGIRPGEDFYRELPYFQEDIAAAWELVREAAKMGYRFTLTCQGDDCLRIILEGGDCNCPIRKPYDPKDGHGFTVIDSEDWDDPTLDDMTVPLAICLAFRKATEG